MKAAVVQEMGRPPVYADFTDPEARAGESIVTVTAAALSQLARGRASGRHYSVTQQQDFVAGVDGVGRLADGRRVYFVLPRAPYGAMAEQAPVADGQWIPLPDGLDDETAAAIANPGMSSWAALTERAQLRPGETVLINGATGASGQLAVKIARHLGAARVIATGRNSQVLAALGADATIPLGSDNDALQAAAAPLFAEGVDVLLDYLWGDSARSLLIAAAKTAPRPLRFVQIGAISGGEIALPAAVLRSSPIMMMGSGIGSIALDRLIAAVAGVLGVAKTAGLALDHRAVPIAQVAETWVDRDARIVYRIG